MASEYLPGQNFACCMLFQDNELLKFVCAERIKYFAGHLFLSGISGNTCEGRLINDTRVRAVAEECVRLIARNTGEPLTGLFTVDMRENQAGAPLVTEINLRHVAFTSAFAAGGANMAEAQLLATMGLSDKIDRKESGFLRTTCFSGTSMARRCGSKSGRTRRSVRPCDVKIPLRSGGIAAIIGPAGRTRHTAGK